MCSTVCIIQYVVSGYVHGSTPNRSVQISLNISRRFSLVENAGAQVLQTVKTETGEAIVSNTPFHPIRIVSRHTQPCDHRKKKTETPSKTTTLLSKVKTFFSFTSNERSQLQAVYVRPSRHKPTKLPIQFCQTLDLATLPKFDNKVFPRGISGIRERTFFDQVRINSQHIQHYFTASIIEKADPPGDKSKDPPQSCTWKYEENDETNSRDNWRCSIESNNQ